jgi:hypothetical protein
VLELPHVVERGRVVDEDVDGPELADGSLDGRVDLLPLRHVAAHGERVPPHRSDLLDRLFRSHETLCPGSGRESAEAVGVLGELGLDQDVGNRHVGARASERQRVGATEAARAAGDESDLPREIDLDGHRHRSYSPVRSAKTPGMYRMTTAERRARLAVRHLLVPAARASTVEDVARALVAIHSTDAATVFLSIRARTNGLDPGSIERELYEDRAVVRILGMRRTLFVVERELHPVVQAACTDAVAARERTRLEDAIGALPGMDDAGAWLVTAEEVALAAVAEAGEISTADVVRAEPMLATKLILGSGRWSLQATAGSRVLPLLAAQGLLMRARPRGTWISGQYRWTPTLSWIGEDLARLPVAEAQAALVRRWLAGYGPGTEIDLRWWTGLAARPVRAALAAVAAVEVEVDGATCFVLPDDLETAPPPEPSAAFLSTLDSTTMGWKERDWYLGADGARLFDSNGNAGPTVWWDGRVVGGWSQRADGEIVYRLLEEVGADAASAVDAEARRLEEWLGDVRLRPGFLPPFQRALAA